MMLAAVTATHLFRAVEDALLPLGRRVTRDLTTLLYASANAVELCATATTVIFAAYKIGTTYLTGNRSNNL